MSIVKSLSVGDGDMFYITHNSDNFTIIDCCMLESEQERIVEELKTQSKGKGIHRFISTHPDDDHIRGLVYLDDELKIVNFYCVENSAIKDDETADFLRYCNLRDGKKVFHIFKGCTRRWMNITDNERGSSGINVLWPVTTNGEFVIALDDAEAGDSPNNISPIITYNMEDGPTFQWMGDLETDFMELIEDEVELAHVDILFAPHHGRETGKVPKSMLDVLTPSIIIVGEAPSEHLHYYPGYNTISQNSAEDITFNCIGNLVHIYSSNDAYGVDFLIDYSQPDTYGHYIGTLVV